MALDARLAAAAALVRPGLPVADIGCDHGKLTAALACSGLYPRVIGSDLRPGPLAKARQTIAKTNCQDRVELRLGDGLSVLSPGEVGTVVIAGVSAQTAWEMLEAAPWIFDPAGPRLVLVPATRHDELRRWLAANGFALVCDRPVEAAGRWYAVMAAEYGGKRRALTLAEALYGDTGRWPEGAAYAAKQREKLAKLRRGAADGSPAAREMDELLEGGYPYGRDCDTDHL